jgi:Fur family ferric uptake transcriptional regulator
LTKERIALLRVICDTHGHFHPQDLEEKLKEEGLGMAASTFYRNLPLLVESGIVRRACIAEEERGGGTLYEHVWGQEHHDHLVCSRCGRKVEFSYPAIDILQEAVARDHGFRLERHHLELVGLCPDCQKP